MNHLFKSSQRTRVPGQGLVEFALILPILLFLVAGIVDFGRVMFTYAMASNALRDAVRRAEIFGYADTTPSYLQCQTMVDTASRVMFARNITIAIWFIKESDVSKTPIYLKQAGQNCGASTVTDSQLATGDMLVISSTGTIPFITPILSTAIPALSWKYSAERTIVKTLTTGDIANDKDYDGLVDSWEDKWFGDNDGVIETSDLGKIATDDYDNDLCNNGCEESFGTNPKVADFDGDSLLDGNEVYVHDTDPTNANTDNADGVNDKLNDGQEVNGVATPTSCAPSVTYTSDPLDTDTDDDGILDGDEITACSNPRSEDTDGDMLSDYDEISIYLTKPNKADSDGDTISDYDEINVYNTNPNTAHSDADGIADNVELAGYDVVINGSTVHFTSDPKLIDTDGDGLNDNIEKAGWTATVKMQGASSTVVKTFYPNPRAADADGDGINDSVEKTAGGTGGGSDPNSPDTDGDGLNDKYEVQNPPQKVLQADAADADADGLPDVWENQKFGNLNSGPATDNDNDGCNNRCEFDNGLNPTVADTDADGLLDGEEVTGTTGAYTRPYNTSPTVSDADGDGLLDGAEVKTYRTNQLVADSDGDGRNDGQEVNGYSATLSQNGSSSTRTYASNPLAGNSDGDGWNDLEEYNRGTNPMLADTDGDGLNDNTETTTDPKDDDSDNDTLKDGIEVNGFTVNGQLCKPNPNNPDTDADLRTDGDEYNRGRNPCVKEIPTLTINDISATEGGNAVFTITLTNPTGSAVTVYWATAPNTATVTSSPGPIDYTTVNSTAITFAAETIPSDFLTKTVTVVTRTDAVDEPNETFYVNLSSPSGGAVIGDGQGVGTILDANATPIVSINSLPTSGLLLENAGTASFTVALTGASSQNVTVNYATSNLTATAGTGTGGDYTASSGTLTFTPGQTTKTLSITIRNDSVVETPVTESFRVTLSSAVNAIIGTSSNGGPTGDATIYDDDGAYVVSFTTSVSTFSESTSTTSGSGTVTLTATLDRPNAGTSFTVPVATVAQTAAGSGTLKDFEPLSGTATISFPTGSTTATLNLTIYNDNWDDSADSETFKVNLNPPAGSTTVKAGTVGSNVITVVDNEAPPVLTLPTSSNVGKKGSGNASMTVTMSRPSDRPVTVVFTGAQGRSPNGSGTSTSFAVNPTHYTMVTSSPLTISAGATSATITFNAKGFTGSGLRYFYVTLSSPTNATVGTASGDAYADVKLCGSNYSLTCTAP
jgi:hypothetical protein